jgi:site-specific DNA-methyltransferase (adenine-specific)
MDRVNEIFLGDSKDILKQLKDESVDCVMTSPPYYQLRDYGVDGQIGLENTIEEYLQRLMEVFDEVKRVLKPDGTLFVNLGDSYKGSGKGACKNGYDKGKRKSHFFKKPEDKNSIIQNKSLLMIPERFAIEMISRGWILRNQIIWHKPNAIPESAKDRFTNDYEKIFFFVKQKKYYFNQIKEKSQSKYIEKRMLQEKREKYTNSKYAHQPKRTMWRNKRSVWSIKLSPSKSSHIAPFPLEIPLTCIKAGCREGGIVLDPFSGSGTTLMAAQMLNRKWIGIEINEQYRKDSLKTIKELKGEVGLFEEN